MAKPRIPLPKQTERVHRDRKSQYDRKRAKQVSLEELNHENLEIFLASDQPEICRYCGKTRTDFIDTTVKGRQLHTCPACGKKYWVDEK
jgi:tRNA(Ile2) C34 agmatinyltransferase TiaS